MRHNKKIRILHIIDTTGPGGAETVLLNIVKSINNNRYKSFIILPDKGWIYKKLQHIPDIDIKIVHGSGRINFSFVYLLRKAVRENKIEIIHSHLFGSSLYSCIVGLLCRVPVVCTFHGYVDIDANHIMRKLKFLIIGLGAKKIVFVSDHLRNYVKRMFPVGRGKCITIYNGINTNSIRRESGNDVIHKYGFSKREILVGSVGNIRQAKGYHVLLKVACIVRERYSNCFFIVAGEGKGELYDRLLTDRKRLKLEEAVYFIGFLDDVRTFLDSVDIFLLTSYTEGFSLSTIEAMNANIPVVVTESGGPQEIVINGNNGIMVKVGDENALANAIIRLIEDCGLKDNIVAMARKTVSDKFKLSTMVQKYGELYSVFTK